jgi:hypothetical protein
LLSQLQLFRIRHNGAFAKGARVVVIAEGVFPQTIIVNSVFAIHFQEAVDVLRTNCAFLRQEDF